MQAPDTLIPLSSRTDGPRRNSSGLPLGHAASSQGDIASSCRGRAWCVCADLTHPTPTPTVPVAFHRTGITQPGWVHGSAGSAGDNPQFSSPLLVALGGANLPCREAMILL